MTKYYIVSAETPYVGDGEELINKQNQLLASLGLVWRGDKSYKRKTICNAEQALALLKENFHGQYTSVSEAVEELFIAGESSADLVTAMERLTTKVLESAVVQNNRCSAPQPGLQLQHFTQLDVLVDGCTDVLQGYLDTGWRILAIQPQPDQRRPDYILGKLP